MAGVPAPVVERAREYVDGTTRGPDGDAATGSPATNGAGAEPPIGNGNATDEPVRERLAAVDLATTTPIEALNLLADLESMTGAEE